MPKIFLAFLIVSLCAASTVRAEDGKPFTMASLLLGQVSLNQGYWAPVDKQNMIGVQVDYNPGDWPINLLGWISTSNQSGGGMVSYPRFGTAYTSVDARLTEFSIGARKYLIDAGVARPYVSAGFSSISADFSASAPALGVSISDSSSSMGYFGNGGVAFLVNRFILGIDFKILTGTNIKLFGVSGDVNYTRFSVGGGIVF